MICFPNAKINVGLNIIQKRNDGYHNIESIMYPLSGIVYDALEIIPVKKRKNHSKLILAGNTIPGNPKDNLCLKAYTLLKQDYPDIPCVDIHLLKAIPIGAGLGGGSADAAFFIRLLNDTFTLGIPIKKMQEYARQLGSDCAFFINNKATFGKEKGDLLTSIPLDLSGYYIALVYPGIHISTFNAYNSIIPQKPLRSLKQDINTLPVKAWKKYIHNDFENPVFQQFPEIKKIKEKLYQLGALYSSMSGSGSAVYGIFASAPSMKKEFRQYKTWEGRLP